MPAFLANLRPRSLPRTKHHIRTDCKLDDNNISSSGNINIQRPRSQIHNDHSHSSSFLANLRPRSHNLTENNHLLNTRSHTNDVSDLNYQQQEHSFASNFRPRSQSSSAQDKYSRMNSQERSFLRLWLRKNKPKTANNPRDSSSNLPPRSKTNSQESASSPSNIRPSSQDTSSPRPRSQASSLDDKSSPNLRPRPLSHTDSQESVPSSSSSNARSRSHTNIRPRSPRLNLRPRSKPHAQDNSSPNLNYRYRRRSSQDNSSPNLRPRPRSQASSQDKSSARLNLRPRSEVNSQQSQQSTDYTDRPRSPVNIPFLSNFRARARSLILEDQLPLPEDPLKRRMATDLPTGRGTGATLPRRRSRRTIRRTTNSNSNDNDSAIDSTQIERAQRARKQVNAATLLTRAIQRLYVKKTVPNSLKELDALIHYAELDLRTIPVVSKRIMGIQSVSNIVVEKQLQAASYLYSLRKKPENQAVQNARNVMNSAAGLLDSNNEQVHKLSKMERSLCETANNLGQISNRSCSAREQVLELLVLMTRKRAEIEIKAAISTSISISTKLDHDYHGIRKTAHVESVESITSEEEEGYAATNDSKKIQDEKENGSPTCVKDNIVDTYSDSEYKKCEAEKNIIIASPFELTLCDPASALEGKHKAAVIITRTWKTKKLTSSNALAYLMRLRHIERDMATCGSISIYHKLTSKARLVVQHIADINVPELSRVASYNYNYSSKGEWDRIVRSGRRNAAISTAVRSVRLCRIRQECIKERLSTIETIVKSAALSNTEAGYKNSLERLGRMEFENTGEHEVLRRKLISGRNILVQKQRQLRRSSKRINELRAIEKEAELNKLEKALAENKAVDYMNWWTEYGKLKGQLRVLLATLHRILPAWNAQMYDIDNDEEYTDTKKIRRLYRKALLLVHPDRLAKARKVDAFDEVLAQKIFVELQHAYDIFVENELVAPTYSATNLR